jgi:hypothetical protein
VSDHVRINRGRHEVRPLVSEWAGCSAVDEQLPPLPSSYFLHSQGETGLVVSVGEHDVAVLSDLSMKVGCWRCGPLTAEEGAAPPPPAAKLNGRARLACQELRVLARDLEICAAVATGLDSLGRGVTGGGFAAPARVGMRACFWLGGRPVHAV